MTTQTQQTEERVPLKQQFKQWESSKVADLVDLALVLKAQIDASSKDLEEIKETFRKLAQLEEDQQGDKTVFVGKSGAIVEVMDDSKTTISPIILKGYLESEGKGDLFVKLVNVSITQVRSGLGDMVVEAIGHTERKIRSKVYIKKP